MSHNRNYNYRHGNSTFHLAPNFPPPPLPPPLLTPFRPLMHHMPIPSPQTSGHKVQEQKDQEFIKSFEAQKHRSKLQKVASKAFTIHRIQEEMKHLLVSLQNIEARVNHLKENVNELTDAEWRSTMDRIEIEKTEMVAKLKKFAISYIDVSRKLIVKRAAKRLRLKRLREERKQGKKERIKHLEERSRKIDENLQKIKDDIHKAKQEKEAKLQADVVLREVSRKKQDAKKCIVKLDALLKLRIARQNTAKGRGENISEAEASSFGKNIEKLKELWNQKLLIYEKEEKGLLEKLKEDAEETDLPSNETEKEVKLNLAKWKEVLFGDSQGSPQADFQGNFNGFVAVRSQWDQYVSCDGTPLPVGWVLPPLDP